MDRLKHAGPPDDGIADEYIPADAVITILTSYISASGPDRKQMIRPSTGCTAVSAMKKVAGTDVEAWLTDRDIESRPPIASTSPDEHVIHYGIIPRSNRATGGSRDQ